MGCLQSCKRKKSKKNDENIDQPPGKAHPLKRLDHSGLQSRQFEKLHPTALLGFTQFFLNSVNKEAAADSDAKVSMIDIMSEKRLSRAEKLNLKATVASTGD